MKDFSYKQSSGFTLAEVLITLGIIGTVAALTIPALISNYQKTRTTSQLKKVYSELKTVMETVMYDYNNYIPFDASTTDNEKIVHDEIMSNMKYNTYCPASANTAATCPGAYPTNFGMTNYSKTMNDIHPMALNSGYSRYILPDGTGIAFSPYWWPGSAKFDSNSNWNGWGDGYRSNIYIDINGKSGPNVTGIDIFALGFSHTGLNFYVTNNNGCNTTAQGECFKKIIVDNWQISSDYPWQS